MKRSRLIHNLVIASLHYIFFVTLLTQRGMGSNLQEVFRFVFPGYVLLLVAGFISMKGRRCNNMHYCWFFVLAFVILPIMCFRAIRAGEPSWRIIDGATPFLMFSLIFLGSDDRIWPRLNRVFIIHTAITSVLIILEIPLYWGVRRGLYFTGATNMWLYERLMYGYPFLLLSWRYQNTLGKIIASLGTATYAVLAILGQHRRLFFLGTAFYILLMVIIYVIAKKEKINAKSFAFIRNPIIAGISSVVIIFLLWFAIPEKSQQVISGSFDELLHRTDNTILAGGTSWQEERRWREMTLDILPQITASEWIIGRGVAFRYYFLTNDSPRARKSGNYLRYGVHMAPAHLIMQGGLFLLLMILLGPVLAGFRSFRWNQDIVTLAASGILIHYFIMFVAQANPTNDLWFVLVCLSMGRCVRQNRISHRTRATCVSQENLGKHRIQENI